MKIRKITVCFLLMVFQLFAVYNGVRASEDPGLPGGDPDVPIDGGTAVLLAAGAVYGFRKLRNMSSGNAQ